MNHIRLHDSLSSISEKLPVLENRRRRPPSHNLIGLVAGPIITQVEGSLAGQGIDWGPVRMLGWTSIRIS